MIELFKTFAPAQIITFIILFAVAFKQVVDFIDWAKKKVQDRDNKVQGAQDEKDDTEQRLKDLESSYEEISTILNSLNENVDLLIQSDKDAIKSFITREHHYYCYQVGWIDDYSLDCLERRYDHYVEEQGYSFIEQLMEELRALPKEPVQEQGKL
jgi:hypothetical protein